uniref:Uncharacterized protein n=1 Tax=Bos indicus x Bos taurus TaxID=30522 RepID=A0A4W2HBQ1_BOBOX
MSMPSGLAHHPAAQTLLWTARRLLHKGQHPAELRRDVCMPSSSTSTHRLPGGLRQRDLPSVNRAKAPAWQRHHHSPHTCIPALLSLVLGPPFTHPPNPEHLLSTQLLTHKYNLHCPAGPQPAIA